MGGLTHSEIDLVIRIILGIDVGAICLLAIWFYFQNEHLALRASKYGPITYPVFGSIFTGIAYGHPDCPEEIANEYKRMRRKRAVYTLYLSIVPAIYLVFLRKDYH